MRALILAAGRGSRMGPLTDIHPKCLTPLGGRPLIARAVDSLRQGGCSEIGVVTGYRAEQVTPFADNVFHNARWAETNMIASLFTAGSWLAEAPLIVSYSDIFYSPETVAALIAAPGPLAIAYDTEWRTLWAARFADPLVDAETFRLGPDGQVAEIGSRPGSVDEVQGQYMGLLKISPAVYATMRGILRTLPAERRDGIDVTNLLSLLIQARVPISAVPRQGPWGECDSESDVRLYERWIAEGRIAA
jgi:choline kinase